MRKVKNILFNFPLSSSTENSAGHCAMGGCCHELTASRCHGWNLRPLRPWTIVAGAPEPETASTNLHPVASRDSPGNGDGKKCYLTHNNEGSTTSVLKY